MCHQGPVFNFYVAGSSFLAVVVAEELVDGVDVNLGKEVATFFGEKVGTVLDVVHEEVLGEDGQADKRAIRVDLCQFVCLSFLRDIFHKKSVK